MASGARPHTRRLTPKPPVAGSGGGELPEVGRGGGDSVPRGAAGPRSDELAGMREYQLHELLRAESEEKRRLQMLLKEQAVKFERSMVHQSELEEDLVAKDAQIKLLGDDLRMLKQRKQSAESELAQQMADDMNAQAKLMEQVGQLNDEVQRLRAKLAESTAASAQLEKELSARAAPVAKRKTETAPQPHVPAAASALEKHETDLIIKELRARHSQLQAEVQETKAMNERLREDNEHFQYLLVERTVAGRLPQAGSEIDGATLDPMLEPALGSSLDHAMGHTLADEEVYEFDTQSNNTLALDAREAQEHRLSLADESNGRSSSTPGSEHSGFGEERDYKDMQQTANRQRFEIQSLQNHNRALKLSLERLVDRLLDNRTFGRAVEEAVTPVVVRRFRQRVASSTDRPAAAAAQSASALGERTRAAGGYGGGVLKSPTPSASMWSNMIFNTQHSGTPSRRVLSLGVDSDVRGPAPLRPQHSGNTTASIPATASTLASPQSRGSGSDGRAAAQGYRNSRSPSAHSIDSSLYVTKRTESQDGLRKLHIRE